MLLERERNGLALPDAKREQLLDVKKRIMALCVDFQRNCNGPSIPLLAHLPPPMTPCVSTEEKGFLLFTKDELDGVPEDVISGYPVQDGGKCKVTHKTPDIVPVFQYANKPETRRRAVLSYEGRVKQNAPLFEQIVRLRREAAGILGYDSWADYAIEPKMAKTASNAQDFLRDLQAKLTPIAMKDRENLLALKREVHDANGWPVDDSFKLWDWRYYDRLFVERHYKVDEELIKQYFPVAKVVPTVLDLYQKLLGVRFVRVPQQEAPTWHEDAETYAVWDATQGSLDSAADATKSFLGYMTTDLFPRDNKYGHAAVWGLVGSWIKPDGSRNFPVVSMVANLAKPTPSKPALMKHSDVVTYAVSPTPICFVVAHLGRAGSRTRWATPCTGCSRPTRASRASAARPSRATLSRRRRR